MAQMLWRIIKWILVWIPAGMGCPPWHRLHPIFKIERSSNEPEASGKEPR